MKRILALAAVLLIAWVIWVTARPRPSGLGLGFAGPMNGVVGPIAPTFAEMTTNHATAIQAWLAAGTNGARFMVTNRCRYAVDIFPVARLDTRVTNGMPTPLLNARNWSGISLGPGQATMVQVAVLAPGHPWRVALCYHRRQSSSWASAMVESLSGVLRPAHLVRSEWIEP